MKTKSPNVIIFFAHLHRKWRMGHLSQTLKKEYKRGPLWGHHLLPHHTEEASFLHHQHHRALHPNQRAGYICLLSASWSRLACPSFFAIVTNVPAKERYAVGSEPAKRCFTDAMRNIESARLMGINLANLWHSAESGNWFLFLPRNPLHLHQ